LRKKIFEIWFYLRWVVLDDFRYWARWKIKDFVTPLMWVGVAGVAIIAIPYLELKTYRERRKKKGGEI